MDNFLLIKLIHIIAAVITMGTGIGIAFFMLMAVRSNSAETIRHITRIVVIADWCFTAPAVVIQLVTGLLLVDLLHYSITSTWFITSASLFGFVGVCWLPVVVIQYRMRDLAKTKDFNPSTNVTFKEYFARWIALGIPAFAAMLIIFWLMVFKPIPAY